MRETHTQYIFFGRQPNKNKEKRKTNKPCSQNNKTETCNK